MHLKIKKIINNNKLNNNRRYSQANKQFNKIKVNRKKMKNLTNLSL